MKQIEEDPWLALPVKYATGTKLAGTVRNLTSFGAFVEIEAGIDGLVHVSDMSWTKRIEHPSEVVQKGQEIDVLVLDVDAENKRISLGVKQLTDDPWPQISERLTPGVELDGHVVRVQEKGVVVDLGDDVEGFVPVSQSGVDDPEKLEEYYGPSDEVSLRVTESDTANRRIVLEVTDTPDRKPQEEIEAARAAAEAEVAAKAEAEGGPDDEDGRSVHRPTAPPSDDADDGADTEAPASPPPAAADAEAEAVAAGGAEESPKSEAEEAPEAEAEEAPEAEAEEAPEAEAEEAPEAEAEEAPEAEAEEAEAEEAPEAEAEEAEAEAEAEEAPEAEAEEAEAEAEEAEADEEK
jgi:small subunit ribosomal protein S1